MEKRIHLYVSRKNALTWMMVLCMVCSVVARIMVSGVKGAGDSMYFWCQIVLPIAATVLFVVIVLTNGKEMFYRTAIPLWMIAVYFGLVITYNYDFGRMNTIMYWICLLFFAASYTALTAGVIRYAWLLVPLLIAPICIVGYFRREALLTLNYDLILRTDSFSNSLMLIGMLLLVFAVRVSPEGEYHPTWGDRIDGRRVRSLSPFTVIIPYIMPQRNGACNMFEESFEISRIDRYIRQKRKEGLTDFGITHVLLAAYCRGLAKYPALNRFLSGQKIFSRGSDIQFSMVVKKEMTLSAPDTSIKLHLTPADTAADVYVKMKAAVDEVRSAPPEGGVENVAQILTMMPGPFLKLAIFIMRTLDYLGLLPKALLEVSPFHGSIFFTSMGSLGIRPVYHHLYDFGNMPIFGAFGCKRREYQLEEDGTIVMKKYIDMKFTIDERIADGYYYAAFFKYYRRLLQHPEVLDLPPEEVVKDVN